MFCSLVLLIETINTFVICILGYISFISRNINKKNKRLRLRWLRQRLAEAETETSHVWQTPPLTTPLDTSSLDTHTSEQIPLGHTQPWTHPHPLRRHPPGHTHTHTLGHTHTHTHTHTPWTQPLTPPSACFDTPPGQCMLRYTHTHTHTHTRGSHCSGWHAFYCNAFFF